MDNYTWFDWGLMGFCTVYLLAGLYMYIREGHGR